MAVRQGKIGIMADEQRYTMPKRVTAARMPIEARGHGNRGKNA